jgi:hypothetical protein
MVRKKGAKRPYNGKYDPIYWLNRGFFGYHLFFKAYVIGE